MKHFTGGSALQFFLVILREFQRISKTYAWTQSCTWFRCQSGHLCEMLSVYIFSNANADNSATGTRFEDAICAECGNFDRRASDGPHLIPVGIEPADDATPVLLLPFDNFPDYVPRRD